MGDGKKRRKKKFKKSLSQSNSEPADNDSPRSMSTTNEQNVPEEIQIKQEHPAATPTEPISNQIPVSQAMPMNLTNEHGKVKSESDSLDYTSGMDESVDAHNYPNAICKIGKRFNFELNNLIFLSDDTVSGSLCAETSF